MTVRHLALSTAMIGAFLVPASAHAQLFGGIYGAYASDSFDGSIGVGGLIGLDIPILPVDIYGGGTAFFPDCEGDCELSEFTLGVNVRLPLPLVRPYLTTGVTWRDVEVSGATIPEVGNDDTGLFAGLGVDLAFSWVRVFAEGRYEFMEDALGDEQLVFRGGVMIR